MGYYYLELLPRIYAATDQAQRRSFLAWTFPRPARQLVPLALFNMGGLVVMLAAYLTYVEVGSDRLAAECLSLGFIAASVVSVGSVLLEVRSLSRAISSRVASSSPAGPSVARLEP